MRLSALTISILFGVLIPAGSLANDKSIDDLLHDYRVASDLSKQTKQESAGSVIIFTREELENMQAYNLRDILKTIPMFTLQETVTGPVSLAKAGGATFNTQYLKLYINDHEMGSVVFGSAMKMWGYMDIAYIDHIEIYQTGSSVSAGDEPPGVVIRLYTKDPERDRGGQLQGIFGSRGSNEQSIYYAGEAAGLSYFLYLNRQDEFRTAYMRDTAEIGRDFRSNNFFASLKSENAQLDVGRFELYHDGLFGLGRQKKPLENYNDLDHFYGIYTHVFQQKSLKLKIAYDKACHIRYDNDPTGIAVFDANGSTTVWQEWYYDKHESVFDVSLSKEWTLGDHDLQLGIQYKNKQYDPVSLETDGVERAGEVSPYRMTDVYGLFAADDIAFGENHLVFGSLKYDYHKRNGGMSDLKNYVARLGYIYNDATWLWKSFAIHTYGYPFFMQNSYFPFTMFQDSSLRAEDRVAVTTELQYKAADSTSGIRLLYNTVDHPIVVENNRYLNSDAKPEFYALYLSHEQRFDSRNKINASVYTSKTTTPDEKSSTRGAYVQFFNGWGDVDLYNELVYRSGYRYTTPMLAEVDVAEGYDYTAAVTYHANNDLSFSLKGENLLDKAIETPYPIGSEVEYVSPFDRTVRFSLRYLF